MTQQPVLDGSRERSGEGNFYRAVALQRQGELVQAERLYRAVLAVDRRHFEALGNLARICIQHGDRDEAAKLLRRALRERPDHAETHDLLGLTLGGLARSEEALQHFDKAVALRPGFAEAHHHRALALQFLNRHPEAIASYRRSLALAPERADAYSHLGNTLEEIGQAAAAQQAFERAVALAPRRGRFYYQLSEHRQFAAGDPYLAAMEELAGDLAALPPDDRIELLFALAKAHADLAEPQRSFECLVAANMLKRRQIDYDEAATLGSFERIRTTFTLALMHADRDLGNPSPVPVFIIGMPRSGTTLIEQILASHPKVFGAGELPEFENAAKCVFGSGDSPTLFPEVVPSLSGAALRRIGTRYVAAVTALAPGASRITDKMPVNFRYAGLIHRALPNARIIHCRRDPIDTCLSCFSKLFTEGQAYSYALGELGRYYRGYYRLMEHWRGVLPAHVMIEVSYEDVVADLETQARRIVAHCGLEWDAACLTFDRTERPIRTASASQVRRPIYRTSVGRWRAYGRLLDPLMEALGPVPGPA